MAACAGTASAGAARWPIFTDRAASFAISYPPGWSIDKSHDYPALGPGKDIHGIAFTLAPALAAGTNLSDSSYLAVETLPGATRCKADLFLDDADAGAPHTERMGAVVYSIQHGSDAGAGNFYDETVYAVMGSKPCLAVRTFIHSTNIGNFDPGTVKAFDGKKLQGIFDAMRSSLRILPR